MKELDSHPRVLFLGGNGRLGTALQKEYAGQDIHVLKRNVYNNWYQENINEIRKTLDGYCSKKKRNIIMVLPGNINPNEKKEDIFNVNFHLPKNIILSNKNTNNLIVTFGTIMEDLSPDANNYTSSKNQLTQFIKTSKIQNILSLKIHTLYGGDKPNAYMFLGQMLNSINKNEDFKMSSGKQIREYHHVDDESKAIKLLANSFVTGSEIISHGEAVSLKDIAIEVYKDLNILDKLKIGFLKDRIEENYDKNYTKNSKISSIKFRNSLDGIVTHLKKYINQ